MNIHKNINVFQHHIYFDLICNLVINKFTATAPVHTIQIHVCIRWNVLAYEPVANTKRISLIAALFRIYLSLYTLYLCLIILWTIFLYFKNKFQHTRKSDKTLKYSRIWKRNCAQHMQQRATIVLTVLLTNKHTHFLSY